MAVEVQVEVAISDSEADGQMEATGGEKAEEEEEDGVTKAKQMKRDSTSFSSSVTTTDSVVTTNSEVSTQNSPLENLDSVLESTEIAHKRTLVTDATDQTRQQQQQQQPSLRTASVSFTKSNDEGKEDCVEVTLASGGGGDDATTLPQKELDLDGAANGDHVSVESSPAPSQLVSVRGSY